MKATFRVLLVALALIALGSRAWTEDSVEDRLKRLEKLVQAQQQQLSDRDSQIQRMTTVQNVNNTIASMPALADAPKADDPNAVSVKWDKGLKFKTKDGATSIGIGGRMRWVTGFVSNDEATQHQLFNVTTTSPGGDRIPKEAEPDFVTLRHAQIDVGGTIYKNVIFQCNFNLANNGDKDISDMWLGIKDIPFAGTFKVGNFDEPLGMEEVESSKYTLTIERSLNSQAGLTLGRNFGLQFSNSYVDDRIGYQLGAFRVTDDSVYMRSNNQYAGTARVAGLPWWEDEGKKHIHLGLVGRGSVVGSQYNTLTNSTTAAGSTLTKERTSFSAGPDVATVNKFLDTGNLDHIDSDWRLGAELGFNYNSFNLQAEYIGVWLGADKDRTYTKFNNGDARAGTTTPSDDIFLQGMYATASWYITGESRNYDKKAHYYGRTSVKRNFCVDGSGFGAVQLVGRIGYLDFSDNNITKPTQTASANPFTASSGPGTMWNATAGVNWYLNPNTKFAANYSYWVTNHDYFYAPNLAANATNVNKDMDFKNHAFTFLFQVDW